MNKKDLSLVVFLILMIPVWLFIDQRFISPRVADPAPSTPASPVETPAALPEAGTDQPDAPAVTAAVTPDAAPAVVVPTVETPAAEQEPVAEEKVRLANEVLMVELSNLGAAVTRADLLDYPATLEDKDKEDGQVVRLDFSREAFAALSYNMVGLNPKTALNLEAEEENRVRFSREVLPGLTFSREVTLGEGYELRVTDRWTNSLEAPLTVPDVNLYLGAMYPQEDISQKFGPYVGTDAKHLGEGVKHYVKTLRKAVGKTDGVYEQTIPLPSDWVGVKNKFFTQVLSHRSADGPGMNSLTLRAQAGEEGAAVIGMAQPSVTLGALLLEPGQTVDQQFSFYVGPISQTHLKALGDKQEELIDFRLFRFLVPLGKTMMLGLNKLYALTGNWGIAIILLTFVVRMLFWPLTQKGAENMKRMSELSPQMKELKEKYKNNPQKLNAEMSAFYKANNVNPMAGCLPMLVQIPVFISLYGVLRVAVELRFAEFLWIKDLSEQEALFFVAGFPVNILPLTMGATMILQQRMTPSNMDEQQKKIMMMMPVVFLFICYNMPAGLLLYWTTSNLISIYQTTHTRRRDAKKAAANGGKTPADSKLKPVKNPKASKAKAKKAKGGKS